MSETPLRVSAWSHYETFHSFILYHLKHQDTQPTIMSISIHGWNLMRVWMDPSYYMAVTYSVKNGNITFWWPEFDLPLHLWPVLHYQILCKIGLMQPSRTHSHSRVLFEKISHSLDMVWKWIVLPVVLVTAWVIHLKMQYRKHTRFWERFSTHHALRMTLESVTNPCDHSTTHAIRELVSILFPWVCNCCYLYHHWDLIPELSELHLGLQEWVDLKLWLQWSLCSIWEVWLPYPAIYFGVARQTYWFSSLQRIYTQLGDHC